jgi:hypothetical protein
MNARSNETASRDNYFLHFQLPVSHPLLPLLHTAPLASCARASACLLQIASLALPSIVAICRIKLSQSGELEEARASNFRAEPMIVLYSSTV